jgi:hypothetical protein
MKLVSATLLFAASGWAAVCAAAPPAEISSISPKQTLDASVNKGLTLYFRTIDYSSTICTDPRVSADAELIASGASLYNDAQADASWMTKQKKAGNCWQQPPNMRFTVTQAYPVYLNNVMVTWVVGVKVPETDKVIGYIPLDQIQLIPIATL